MNSSYIDHEELCLSYLSHTYFSYSFTFGFWAALLLRISWSSCWRRWNRVSLLLSGDAAEHISAFLASCPPLSLTLLSVTYCWAAAAIFLSPWGLSWKKTNIKMIGKGEDSQHYKLALYLCLCEAARVCGIVTLQLHCFLVFLAEMSESRMWTAWQNWPGVGAKSRQYIQLNSQSYRPTRLHYSARIYWASGTKLFINIDLVPGC